MRYNPKAIEKKWQAKWLKEKIYEPDIKKAKKPFYNLMMFPYPSAEGLHVGNMYAFVGADIYGRFKRMQGFDVFEPIGLDGFGIHSENYAIKIGKHPAEQAKISQKNFYNQLQMIGNGFAWDERLETYDPKYYKWTQWIFIQMFKRGLAYRKKAEVNWCPSCKTVLADEQVIGGECERCGSKAIKKALEQWFFKITEYAERLLNNLEKIDWSERVKIAQRNWIGRSEGVLIKFRISSAPAADFAGGHRGELIKSAASSLSLSESDSHSYVEVFTTRPDTLFGATYLVLGPEHTLIQNSKFKIQNWSEVEEYINKSKSKTNDERIAQGLEKTGVELRGVKTINPANNEEIPIWVADYVLGNVGTGAIMAVPAHDQRDLGFALKYNLPINVVIARTGSVGESRAPGLAGAIKKSIIESGFATLGDGFLVNSGKFNGMPSEKAKDEITKFVSGKKQVNYRLRDWLISRQRYWGPPIPMIFCNFCKKALEKSKFQNLNSKTTIGEINNPGWIAVPEKNLPVLLPDIKNFRPTGTDKSPLATVEKFYKVKCPKCKAWARRETDVSDTFLDSAWYYIGYLMITENSKFKIQNSKFRKRAKHWLPVDMYIGGAEHSVLHLLYSRFLTMALHDMGLVDFSAKGGSASVGEEPFTKFRAHGLLIKDGAKMSKSKGNVVNPDEYIRAYGADALRMYLMFLGPFEQGGDFRDTGIKGITRFLERVWNLLNSKLSFDRLRIPSKLEGQNPNYKQIPNFKIQKVNKLVHQTIEKVSEDIESLQYNTAISALMILLNEFKTNKESVDKNHIKIFLKLFAPFAPFLAEELYQAYYAGKKYKSIHLESWPAYDPNLIKEEIFELIVQINGKVRDKFEVEMGIDKNKAEQLTLGREKVKLALGNQKPKKVIYVPNRLINIVV